jgi:menaquinone-9 beta-reductase
MPELKPITIVGGGLAGLTLGIGLRRQGVPATIYEAGHYPRHRVCGEFISGRGQQVLAHLDLIEALERAGATRARSAAFFLGRAGSPSRALPQPALCLSRFALDAVLAAQFREAGGDLRVGERWRDDFSGEGVVRANGRRSQTQEHGWRWFGLKVHAREVSMGADLEMHTVPGGYVGLCRLGGGVVNVCGLFRRPASAHEGHPPAAEMLRGSPDTKIHQVLSAATFDEHSWCSVAALPLSPQRASEHADFCLGDALTMIPPVTGNGMSMAFETAEMALGPLGGYSRGESSWSEARRMTAGACDRAFAQRLAWAKWLQWIMFTPALQGRLGQFLLGAESLWQFMFARTR